MLTASKPLLERAAQSVTSSRHVRAKVLIGNYEASLAPSFSEHKPLVKVFFDSDCDREPVEVHLHPKKTGTVYETVVTGVPKQRELHHLFAIGFKSYVWSQTDTGIPVETDGGQDYVLVKDVMQAHQSNRDYVKNMELRILSAGSLLKGKFIVTIPMGGLSLGSATLSRPMTLASKYIGGNVDAKLAAEPVLRYITQVAQVRQETLPQRSELHGHVLMYAYLGGPGLELTQNIPLPAEAFMLFEEPKSDVAFWRNAAAAVMRRQGLRVSNWGSLTLRQKATVMKEAICYVPQYLPYKSDEADRNVRHSMYQKALRMGIEDFECALEKGSGDCEDLAMAIIMILAALRSFHFDPRRDAALDEMGQIARQYFAGLVLCTVTSAAVTGADDTNQSLGAHMAALLIPQAVMRKWVSRADPAVARKLPFDPNYLDESLRVEVLEGTGQYYSKDIAEGAWSESAMQDLATEPCFASMKTPIMHQYGTRSPFYRHAMLLMIPDFERRGSSYIGFWFKNTRDGMQGVAFEDLENDAAWVSLVPRPEIPADVMDIMREDSKIRVPPNPLKLSEMRTPLSMRHEQADRVVAAVERLGRRPPPGGDVPPVAKETRHNLFLKGDADSMIGTLMRHPGVYKVTYETELIMDGESPGIRFLIYDAVQQPLHLLHKH